MRFLSRAMLLAAMLIPVLGPAASASPLNVAAGGTNGMVLPSETCRGVFIVPVTVGEGEGKILQLLLDTGSSWTFVNPGSIRRILGRPVDAGKVVIRKSRIGQHTLGALRVRVYPMTALSLALGREIDGILGFPAFKDVLLTLDYPAQEVRVSSGQLPPADGHEIFRDAGGKRPELKVDVGGRRVKVLLDSGATGRFLLKPTDRLTWTEEPRPVSTSMTFWGVVVDEGGRLDGVLQFGPLSFEAPIALVRDDERLAGWHVLHHFVLTFDQKNDRIQMQPGGTDLVRHPALVGSGFGVRPRLDGLEIVRVFPGTSAEAVGLRKGDLILSIDGVPVHDQECGDPAGEPAGQHHVLSYLRDGVQAEARVQNETLIP